MTELKPKGFEDLMGVEYTGVKGQDAVDKLLQEKQGHVKDAFYQEDAGWIDIYWGDKDSGLCHIIKRRAKMGMSGIKFARGLADVLEKGASFPHKNPNRLNIVYKGKLAVITFELKGTETTALLTAFRTNSTNKKD